MRWNRARKKAVLFPLILLCLTLLLAGCRTRTTETDRLSETAVTGAASSAVPGKSGDQSGSQNGSGQAGDGFSGGASFDTPGGSGETGGQKNEEPGGRTRENPEASRKEYDENAPAEIVPGTDRSLHSEGEGNGSPLAGEEAEEGVSRLNDQAEEPAVQTLAAEEAEQTGVDPDAEAADSALTYYTVLLADRTGSLFECQRASIYWETVQDHVTVHKSSPEHALILNAGDYDVSARLLAENLKVDDGWVVRKNPGVIVKIVNSSVLGSGVLTVSAARGVWQRLTSREGWRSLDAVRSGRVLLLSEELLQAPYLQVAAMVMIAKTAHPDLYSDVDPEEALRMLAEEATGMLPAGIYAYQEEAQ